MSQDEAQGGKAGEKGPPEGGAEVGVTTATAQEAELLWHVQTADGEVRKVTLDQLNDAFQGGRVDASLRVRAPGAAQWSTLGERAALNDLAPPAAPSEPSSPSPAEATQVPSPDVEIPSKRPRPVLGPALTLSAALLWAFVVIGTFTTSWVSGSAPLGEGVAILLIVLATVGVWAHAVRSSRSVPMLGRRALFRRTAAVGLLAFAMWGVLVTLATQAGKASSANIDAVVTAGLLIAASIAAFAGRRLTVPMRPERTRARRFAVAALWISIAALTLGACAEILGESRIL